MKHEVFALYQEQYVANFSLQNKVIDQAHTDKHLQFFRKSTQIKNKPS